MSAPAFLPRTDLHGDAVTAEAFPEGVWSVPTPLVLGRSASAAALLIRQREFALQLRPCSTAKVFRHSGRYFAIVDYPEGEECRPSLIFAVYFDDHELAQLAPKGAFGRREVGDG